MQYRIAGRTGLSISRLSFGTGPVSGLMTGANTALQTAVVSHALELGINWFDTAPGYGDGTSEQNLGSVLESLRPVSPVHLATKVRLLTDSATDFRSQILLSVERSLKRLRAASITLLQLHNGITTCRHDEPFSLSVQDVLGDGCVASVFRELQQQGVIRAIGLTGTGTAEALHEVIRSEQFDMIQLPYNLLNPSAGQVMRSDFPETNYGNILEDCLQTRMGVLAIRVYAGGAILGAPPSAHTFKTPFFPLDLYQRDTRMAAELQQRTPEVPLRQQALRFALAHPAVHSAIIGFGAVGHLDEAAESLRDS